MSGLSPELQLPQIGQLDGAHIFRQGLQEPLQVRGALAAVHPAAPDELHRFQARRIGGPVAQVDDSEPAGVRRPDLLGGDAGEVHIDHVHQDFQVVRPHLVLEGEGLLHAGQLRDDGELQIQGQAELGGLLAQRSIAVHHEAVIPGPHAGQHLGGPQFRPLLEGGPVVGGEILPDPEQLNVQQLHPTVLQGLPDCAEQGRVVLQMDLGLPLQAHGDGAEADIVVSGLPGDLDLMNGIDAWYGKIGERKLP